MAPEPAPSDTVRRSIAESAATMPFGDRQDFDDATRGFIGRRADRQIFGKNGNLVWDFDAYGFLDDEPADTAHPSLWRQGQLLIQDGLFEVVPGIYQLRGFDLSVMSIIETETGVIVIDPLISRETAAAAWELYCEHRGERQVHAMIYTHSHVDHFGGVKGVITDEDVTSGRTQVIAPEGFMHYAVSENVFAGPAMTRRAGYMYGAALPKNPACQIGSGLGQTTSLGEATLIPPTVHISTTGEELTIDGVRIVFQVTPGTEAPAEMNFYFPDFRALCTAENTSHTLHNILTIRGAEVRDARAWAAYLTETIDLWGGDLDLVFASHHWPTWGRERAVEFLATQRDMYAYLHDQTLRLMNQGFTGPEIAEVMELPPALEQAWHAHGYYGSVSHNVKAIYQRYMGWYDANPAHLWQHPPEEQAKRYVAAMGGADAAVAEARRAVDEGDLRWATEVLNHVLFSGEDHAEAKALQADVFEQIGWGSENGTWRNAFLSGAYELRNGNFGTPNRADAPDMASALSVEQIFGAVAVRIDGPKAWDQHLVINWYLTDQDRTYVTELRNGTLNHRWADPVPDRPTLSLTRVNLIWLILGRLDVGQALADGTIAIDGDAGAMGTLVGLVAPVDPSFEIVLP
jgi:alkyl sulfatase BDS1-like metallo-beta-lactamase superfamily hydrolase